MIPDDDRQALPSHGLGRSFSQVLRGKSELRRL